LSPFLLSDVPAMLIKHHICSTAPPERSFRFFPEMSSTFRDSYIFYRTPCRFPDLDRTSPPYVRTRKDRAEHIPFDFSVTSLPLLLRPVKTDPCSFSICTCHYLVSAPLARRCGLFRREGFYPFFFSGSSTQFRRKLFQGFRLLPLSAPRLISAFYLDFAAPSIMYRVSLPKSLSRPKTLPAAIVFFTQPAFS